VSNPSVDERRAHVRHPTDFAIQGTPNDGGVAARMVARNLSLGGLYCSSTTDFPEMTRLAVRLMLPRNGGGPGDETDPVEVEAVVVRHEAVDRATGDGQRFDLALFFTQVDDAARTQLERYLDRG